MAKNRKYQSAAIRFGPVLKAFLFCVLIGGAGVGYVWQKSQIEDLGQQIAKRGTQLKQLEVQNEKLRNQLAAMRRPLSLEARVRELNLGLVPASPAQRWTLPEPVDAAPAAARQYAQGAESERLP